LGVFWGFIIPAVIGLTPSHYTFAHVRWVKQIAKPPAFLDPYFQDALLADTRGDFTQAVRYYELAFEKGACGEGTRCAWHKLLTETILQFKEQSIGNSGSPFILFHLGIAYSNKFLALKLDMGKKYSELADKSERSYQAALVLQPDNISPKIGLAALQGECGDFAEAERWLPQILPVQTKSPQDLYNIGYLFSVLQQKQEALYYLELALSSNCDCLKWAEESDDYYYLKNDPDFFHLLQKYRGIGLLP
jgi:tetratricopeptide (TPR) repeat protein